MKADLILTDPPYNVAVKNSQGMTIQNDNLNDKEFGQFLTASFKAMSEHLKEGGAFYIWYASKEHINFEMALNAAGLYVRQQLIWVKSQFILGRQDYHWKHEPCLYGWKEGAAHYFINDRTQESVIEDLQNINKMSKDELKSYIKELRQQLEKEATTVIKEDKPTVNTDHPTMKPIKLLAREIKNSSVQDEIILDPFGGSGSTLIACEQLDRRCYTMELDEKYCDVIIKRWETLSGKKAVILSNIS